MKIRLKVVQNDDQKQEMPCEEFDVNFLELQYLAKDLNKLGPYNFPLIIFTFQQVGVNIQYGSSQQMSGYVDRKGMYFTTNALFDKLVKQTVTKLS